MLRLPDPEALGVDLVLLQEVLDVVNKSLNQTGGLLGLAPHQHIFRLAGGLSDHLGHHQVVGGVGGLGEDADAHPLLGQGHRIHVVGHLAENVGLRADLPEPLPDGLDPGLPGGDDQGLAHQLGQGDLVPGELGQGVLFRDDGHPGLPAHGEALQMLGVVGGGDDRQVGQTLVQAVQHVVAAAVPQAVPHQGKFLTESGDPPGGEVGGPALHQPQKDGARHAALHSGQHLAGLVLQVQQLDGPAQEQAALVGEGQAPFAPDKELDAQFLLQAPDLVAQGRLAHVQLFRGPGDVQLLGHRDKVAEGAQFHSKSPQNYHIKKIW